MRFILLTSVYDTNRNHLVDLWSSNLLKSDRLNIKLVDQKFKGRMDFKDSRKAINLPVEAWKNQLGDIIFLVS